MEVFDVVKTLCKHQYKHNGSYHIDSFKGPTWGTVFKCEKCGDEWWKNDEENHNV